MKNYIAILLLMAFLITVCACSDDTPSRVEKVIKLIGELENITLTPGHEYQVAHAEQAYNGLTEEEKPAVTNFEVLQNALALMEEFNVTAKEVNEQISTLPADLMPEDISKLITIEDRYLAMSEEGRKLVTEYDKLEALLKDYEIWYGEYSPYEQMKAFQNAGKHGRVVGYVTSDFPGVIPAAFLYGYSILISRSLTVYTRQRLDEGEYSLLLTTTNSELLRNLDQRCTEEYRALLGEAYLKVAQQYCDKPNAAQIRFLYDAAFAADIPHTQLVSIRNMWSDALAKEAQILYNKGQHTAIIALHATNEQYKSFSFSPEFRNIAAKSYIAEAKNLANSKQYFDAILNAKIAQALAIDLTIQEEARQTAAIDAKAHP